MIILARLCWLISWAVLAWLHGLVISPQKKNNQICIKIQKYCDLIFMKSNPLTADGQLIDPAHSADVARYINSTDKRINILQINDCSTHWCLVHNRNSGNSVSVVEDLCRRSPRCDTCAAATMWQIIKKLYICCNVNKDYMSRIYTWFKKRQQTPNSQIFIRITNRKWRAIILFTSSNRKIYDEG